MILSQSGGGKKRNASFDLDLPSNGKGRDVGRYNRPIFLARPNCLAGNWPSSGTIEASSRGDGTKHRDEAQVEPRLSINQLILASSICQAGLI